MAQVMLKRIAKAMAGEQKGGHSVGVHEQFLEDAEKKKRERDTPRSKKKK